MAYPNQENCESCGKSIPALPEDATWEEMLCNYCYELEEENSEE